MRSLMPLMAVLALAVSAMMISMAGVGSVISPDPAGGLQGPDELNNSDAGPAEGGSMNGSASSANDGDIVGVIISGLGAIANAVGMVVLLQWELMEMGFPIWFAVPVGTLAQLIVGWGFFETAINRRWN